MVFGGKFRIRRCNSKASYLPRQSLEKLNNADPDHGSYKLTLTSNEDLVGHAKPGYDILAHNGKLPSNLPDVLPLGAKLQPQPQPASPTAANGSPLRYSSNGNLSAASTPSPTQQPPATCYPSMYPAQHRYSTPAMTSSKNYFNNNSNNNSNNSQATNNYTRSQSYDVNSNPNTSASSASPTKFMSQSTIDLKRTHNLETTQEEAASTEGATVPASAQSETNLSSISHSAPAASPVSRTVSLDERGEAAEGRIVRAELVNTTLPASPSANANANNNNNNKTVTRKDSLRENIEKITQLQSKLMSAHLADSGLLGGYSAKAAPSVQTSRAELELESKPSAPRSPPGDTAGDDADKERPDSSATAESCATPPALPKTPPPVAGSEDATASQISQMDSDTDGLKLMQRSELVLRVNPATVETASQTDALPEGDMGRLTESLPHAKDEAQTRTTLQPRRRHPIELSCELMARELAELLPPDDKLVELLTPRTVRSPADYVANLYNPDVPLRPGKRDVGTSTLMRMRARDSAHGDGDGEKHGVTVELQYAEIEVSLANGSGPESCDMLKKKVDELIKQLNRKLKILNREQTTLGEEAAINDELGSGLVSKLADKVRPIEASKFRTYIDDVGHITSLLLSLSERLAKAENSLSAFAEDNAEKKVLESKRDRLLEQLEEAKRLKEDIDRRGSTVTGMLERNLTADEFADFDYFINMKAKLIADARDIADKIKCGEEQLCALSEALIQSDC